MIQFDPLFNDHIYAMQNWHRRLMESGELEQIFMPSMNSIAVFVQEFSHPAQTFMDFDKNGLFVVISMRPWLGGVCQTFWVREDKRHSPGVFKAWIKVLNAYFEIYPVIIGITKIPRILEEHTKLGYDVNQAIPDLFGDKPGWIVYMHRSNFKYLKAPENELTKDLGTRGNGASPEAVPAR